MAKRKKKRGVSYIPGLMHRRICLCRESRFCSVSNLQWQNCTDETIECEAALWQTPCYLPIKISRWRQQKEGMARSGCKLASSNSSYGPGKVTIIWKQIKADTRLQADKIQKRDINMLEWLYGKGRSLELVWVADRILWTSTPDYSHTILQQVFLLPVPSEPHGEIPWSLWLISLCCKSTVGRAWL